MLEINDPTQMTRLLAKLPCEVRVPAEWRDNLVKQGMLPTVENDGRRLPRRHFFSKAALETKTTLPAIVRETRTQAVYTRDISRGGVSFLHAEQLYPGETCRMWFSELSLQVTVVRCSRVNSKCYLVGGTFSHSEPARKA